MTFKRRFAFNSILESFQSNTSLQALIGARGIGKTILLLQIGLELKNSFYLSADQLDIHSDLFDVVTILVKTYKVKYLLIDEIHTAPNFAKSLKTISDFLNIRVFATSSASLTLENFSMDLSRRIQIHYLFPFSFREFLYFKRNILAAKLTLSQILNSEYQPEHLLHSHLFKEYLEGGLFAFTLKEKNKSHLFVNILKKIIYKDIAVASNLGKEDLRTIEKVLAFIGKSSVDGINNTSLSKNLGISKYKAEEYVELLTRAFLLNPIYPKGANVIREPKILMNLPLIVNDFSYNRISTQTTLLEKNRIPLLLFGFLPELE